MTYARYLILVAFFFFAFLMGRFRSSFSLFIAISLITKFECANIYTWSNSYDYLWILETPSLQYLQGSCSLLIYSPFIFRAVCSLLTFNSLDKLQIFHFQQYHTHTESLDQICDLSIYCFVHSPILCVSRQSFTNNGSDASLEFKMTQLNAFSIQLLIKIHWIKWMTSWEIGCLE